MLGRLNQIENKVLDALGKNENIEINELTEILASLNYAVDSAQIGICQWNFEKTRTRTNNQFLKNFGYYEYNDPTKPFITFLTESFFSEDAQEALEYDRKLLAGEIDSYQYDIRQKVNNQVKWWRFIVKLMDSTDDSPWFTAASRDVTSEKEMLEKALRREQQLRELNSRLNGSISELESTHRAMMHARSLLELSLHESNAYVWEWNVLEGRVKIDLPSLPSSITNMNTYTIDKVLEKIYPEDISKIQIDRIVAGYDAQATFSIDLRIDYLGTGYKWFEFRGCVTERDPKGRPANMKGLAIDIQKRKDEEKSAVQLTEKAVESEKQKNSFLLNITNEFRTPLQAIVAFSELLATMDDREERMKYLAAIKQNNDILLGMIGNVLDYSDAAPQEEPLKEVKLSIWEYMVEMQQMYSMKIQGPIRLIFTNSYDNLKILIDKEKLDLIMDQLLTNAIKFTKSGYISYGYEVKMDKIMFVINDTGLGIADDKLRDIFSSFDSREVLSTGGGQGLQLCKSLVKKMKGEIRANSQVGAGSSFIVELPLKIEGAVSPVVIKKEVENPYRIDRVDEKRDLPTILIAEDIVYSYMMMKTLLEDRFNIIHAENGERAVELFQSEKPDFIFMDIKMPLMDGLEATRRIRQISSTVPVVVLTAYAVRSLKKEAAEAGCTDILTKPTTAKQINAVIRKHMKN